MKKINKTIGILLLFIMMISVCFGKENSGKTVNKGNATHKTVKHSVKKRVSKVIVQKKKSSSKNTLKTKKKMVKSKKTVKPKEIAMSELKGEDGEATEIEKASFVGKPNFVSEILTDEFGRIIDGENIDYVHPIASLTKMMTALLAIEKIERGQLKYTDFAEVPVEATKLGESSTGLKAGEMVTVLDLLKCAIIKSGNDSAFALAVKVGGSESAFIENMNKRAKELGMNNTKYTSTCGLPPKYFFAAKIAPIHRGYDISTARDTSILAKELVKHKSYIEISSKYYDKIKDGKVTLRNRNRLIAEYWDIDGLKTGFHVKSRYNIAVSSKKDGVRLIAVVFGAPSLAVREKVVVKLLNKGYGNFGLTDLQRKERGVSYNKN